MHVQTNPNPRRTVRLYKEVRMEPFEDIMHKLEEDLQEMTDPNAMWNLFVDRLNHGIDQCVPTKELKPRRTTQPEWFNKTAEKLTTKHRKTYNKYKRTGDPFYLEKYRTERRQVRKSSVRFANNIK